MSTALLELRPTSDPAPSLPEVSAEMAARGQVVIENVSWETYEMLLQDVREQHISITYDNGRMALMSPLPIHTLLSQGAKPCPC